jgi:hypothetical protein
MPLGSLTPGFGGRGLNEISDFYFRSIVSGSRSDLLEDGFASLHFVLLKACCVDTATGFGGSIASGLEYFSRNFSSGVLLKPCGCATSGNWHS